MRKITVLCMAFAAAVIVFAGGYGFGRQTASMEAWQVSGEAPSPSDPISEFRTERQQLRQMQISQLNELIYGGDDAVAALARGRLLELMEWAEDETTIEGVLKMREFEDAVVTVHEDSVNVLVKSDVLSQQQTAVILEIVMRETGISGGNVKIIPIN